jgi:hypothetical protein
MKPLFIGLVTGATAALPLLTPSPAHAISCAATSGLSATGTCTIEDAGNTYDISLVTDTFANAFPTFSTDNMFWWGDGGKAGSAALAVGNAFGFMNEVGFNNYGPTFAHSAVDVGGNFFHVDAAALNPGGLLITFCSTCLTPGPGGLGSGGQIGMYSWARSSLVSSAAVPGPLPVLGAAAAFGFSRKLRKRIMQSRSIVRAQAVA